MAENNQFSHLSESELNALQTLFSYLREKREETLADKLLKISAQDKGSKEDRRANTLKAMMSDPKLRNYLKMASGELYKEGLRIERGNEWKMGMKDIEKATGASEEEILDPEKGWLTGNFKDLKFLMESEGLDYADALEFLRDAQTKKARKDLWKNEPWYNRAAMTLAAPLTSEELSKGKPVDDIKTADYVGMASGLIPYGGIAKGAGTVGRMALDIGIPSLAEGVAGYFGDDMSLADAAIHSSENAAGAGIAAGLLKNGLKGVGALSGIFTKEGKKIANQSEDALKEGFYRKDLEKSIGKIAKKMKNRIPLSNEERELYKAYNFLKETGADLSDLGKFSQSKLDNYLSNLKNDPLNATAKGRTTGKIGPNETVYERRERIKQMLDPDEQIDFDMNPGTVEFTDLAIKSDKPHALTGQGWSKEAGFGPTTAPVKDATLKGHVGISGTGRPSIAEHIEAGRKAGLGRTDPYYPRNMEINEAVKQVLTQYPQLKSYFSKSYKDPETRDYILNVVIPTFMRHGTLQKDIIFLKDDDKKEED